MLLVSDGLRVKSKSKKWLYDFLLTSERIRMKPNMCSLLYTSVCRNLKVKVHNSLIQQLLQSLEIVRQLEELFSKNGLGHRE